MTIFFFFFFLTLSLSSSFRFSIVIPYHIRLDRKESGELHSLAVELLTTTLFGLRTCNHMLHNMTFKCLTKNRFTHMTYAVFLCCYMYYHHLFLKIDFCVNSEMCFFVLCRNEEVATASMDAIKKLAGFPNGIVRT